MSATAVKNEIARALKNNIVSLKEAGRIVRAAGPTVDNAEAKAIGDLYMSSLVIGRGHLNREPRIGKAAGEKLNRFFIQQKLPYGEGAKTLVEKIEAALARAQSLPQLDEKPDVSNLHALQLPYPEHANDFPSRTAFYDVERNEFFLRFKGGFVPTIESWVGPVSLEEPAAKEPEISPATLERVQKAYFDFTSRALIDWDRLPTTMPLGARTVEKEFMRERRPNGYAYAAVFQVGALAPGAEAKDPNTLDRVFVKRTGPDGTRILGPLELKDESNGVRPETLERVRQTFERMERAGTIGWSSTLNLPAGLGVTEALLKKEPGFDTYTYKVLLPSGGFPGQPPVDPNQASQFWMKREGGFAGLTQYAGPFRLEDDVGGPIIERRGGAGSVQG